MIVFSKLARSLGLKKPPRLSRYSALSAFIDENAAFVSQVSLYTYVKARAGTSFPKLFEHDAFVTSLEMARWHIFGASVSDLSLFAAAQFRQAALVDDSGAAVLAYRLGGDVLAAVEQDDVDGDVFIELAKRLEHRARSTDFVAAAETGDLVFGPSVEAFIRWAPMVDEFKRLDDEIMRNSMNLRWISVRRELRERLDTGSVYADWSASKESGD